MKRISFFKKNLIVFFVGLFALGSSQSLQSINRQEFLKTLSATEMEKFENFLNLSTKEAQDLLPKFSDDEISKIWDAYRIDKSLSEQRIFWLLQAQAERKADAVASTRLFYLYLALLLLGSLFFIFIFTIYNRQKKFLKDIENK